MPLFRRGPREPRPTHEFAVGVADHRIVVGGAEAGVTMLDDLRGYVAAVTGGAATPTSHGRDSVAVLSAKMDYAELVNDIATVVLLTFEELTERGLVDAAEVPVAAPLPDVPQRAQHYDYIQAAHARAEVRMAWLDEADSVLRAHGVGVLPPLPKEEPQIHLR